MKIQSDSCSQFHSLLISKLFLFVNKVDDFVLNSPTHVKVYLFFVFLKYRVFVELFFEICSSSDCQSTENDGMFNEEVPSIFRRL